MGVVSSKAIVSLAASGKPTKEVFRCIMQQDDSQGDLPTSGRRKERKKLANFQKYTMAAVGHMFNHYGRATGDNVQRGNEKIDPNKTHLNYDLHTGKTADGDKNDWHEQVERLNKRLSEVRHMDLSKRKDINVIADLIVTLPQDVPLEKSKEFFKAVYDFACERYGKDNIISAWVHVDETTPHIHIPIVPTVKDEDGTERLCAKARISRTELSRFHPELQKYVEEKMGQEVGILNGATAGGNRTLLELREKELLEKIQKLEVELSQKEAVKTTLTETENSIAEIKQAMRGVAQLFSQLDKDLKQKKWFGDAEKAKMQSMEKDLEAAKDLVTNCDKALKSLNTALKSNLPKTYQTIFDTRFKEIADLQKQAERRIKREENKLNRKAKRLSEKEKNIDKEIEKGVQERLEKLEKPIRQKQEQSAALDEEIRQKKQQIANMQTDFWSSQIYLKAAHAQQERFTDIIKEWSKENESKNVESDLSR